MDALHVHEKWMDARVQHLSFPPFLLPPFPLSTSLSTHPSLKKEPLFTKPRSVLHPCDLWSPGSPGASAGDGEELNPGYGEIL